MRKSFDITKVQTQALRGMAILCIMLHNYCHWLPSATQENEFTFSIDNSRELYTIFNSDFIIQFFSFFGHYGVAVFLFLSGYGLVKKYEKHPHFGLKENVSFLWNHFKKLFILMICGYFFFMVIVIKNNLDTGIPFDRILAQLTMTINFVYSDPQGVITPGPYWFFGLMIQLYAIYIFFLHRWRSTALIIAIVLSCWLVQTLIPTEEGLRYCRYNFIGNFLPFAAGILFARHNNVFSRPRINARWYSVIMLLTFLFSLSIIVAGGFWFHSWLWIPLFVIIASVSFVQLLPQGLLNVCVWVGTISASLFAMHPLVRQIILYKLETHYLYMGLLIYLALSIIVALLFNMVLKRLRLNNTSTEVKK